MFQTKEGQILGKDYVILNVRGEFTVEHTESVVHQISDLQRFSTGNFIGFLESNSLEVSVRASKEVILPGDTVDLLCHVAGALQKPNVIWSRLGASFLPSNVAVAGSMLTVRY